MKMIKQLLHILATQGWALYLMLALIFYDVKPFHLEFWLIYIPTMILVSISNTISRLEGENSVKPKD